VTIQTNPDVLSTVQTPDTYIYISTAPTATTTAQPKNLFLLATGLLPGSAAGSSPYSVTLGAATANTIKQYTDIAAVNRDFGRRSPIANRFRAALQQREVGLNIFLAAIQEPTNTNFAGFATKILTFGGTAVGSGELSFLVAGHPFKVAVANGDTAAVIAAATLAAAGTKALDCPMVPYSALISSATVPLCYVTRGADGNVSPIEVVIPPEITGITISPGAITIATNALGAAAGPSTFTLYCGALSVSAQIAIGSTPTQAASLIKAAINAATFPLTADSSAGVLTLYYRSGWPVNALRMSSTEDTSGQTYTLADRHDSAGALASVATVGGSATITALQGSGAPTLTTLLANKAKLDAFIEWAGDYSDTTSLGAIYAHIEQYANGYYNKGQRYTCADARSVEDAKTIPTATSPVLGNSWRYAVLTCQDQPSQAPNDAVALAAEMCALDLPYNLDGTILKSGNGSPMLPARSESELSPTTQDVALGTYHLTVVKGENGNVTVVRGKTVWTGSNTEWGDLSYGRIFDLVRFQLKAFLNNRFAGKMLFVGGGQIRIPNAFTLADVKNAIGEYLFAVDGILVDNARSLLQYIVPEVDPNDGTFIRFAFRLRVPREAHVKSGVVSGVQ